MNTGRLLCIFIFGLFPLIGFAQGNKKKVAVEPNDWIEIKTYEIGVAQNISFHEPAVSIFKIDMNPSLSKTIWLSESDIRCSVLPYASGLEVMMECLGPHSYKMQVSAHCTRNNSMDTAISFFVGIEGKVGAHRNFKLWCKR